MLRIKSTSRQADGADTESGPDLATQINDLLNRGEVETAYPLVRELAATESQSVRIHTVAGVLAVSLGHPEDASDHFSRALSLAPDDFDANYNMALSHMEGGRYDQARECFLRLRNLQPENGFVLNDIAITWAEQGQTGRALASFSRAMRVDPHQSGIRNNAMQFCLEQKLPDSGLRLLEKFKKRSQLNPVDQAEVCHWQGILNSALDRA